MPSRAPGADCTTIDRTTISRTMIDRTMIDAGSATALVHCVQRISS